MKTVASNKKARFDYQILDTFEAGVSLTGPEAKSCRMGHITLVGSYVSFVGGRAILKNAKISKYAYSLATDHLDMRDRPLLLKKAEMIKLEKAAVEKGVTVVPLEVKAGRYIKIVIGVARGRKKFDKRQTIKEREVMKRLKMGQE